MLLFLSHALNVVLYKYDFPTIYLFLSSNHRVHKNSFGEENYIPTNVYLPETISKPH